MNFNKVILGGNITRDPELSYLPNQTAVCKFGMAVNKKYKDKESTCFVDCEAFGKTAENLAKYVKRGNPLLIEGELKYDTWTAQDGRKASKHKISVFNFQFVGKTETTQSSAPQDGGQEDIPF